MALQRQQEFIVKYSINYPSGKKWVTERKAMGITRLGAIDTIKWIHSNNDVSIISVEPTGVYSAFAAYGNNHTLGER
jgi:hypothetical protein